MHRTVWLALSYNVPINPSKVRVYVWRKLKEFGAEYLRQGVALLPNSAQNFQQLSALAKRIRELGGEASLLEMRFTDPADELAMTARFQKQTQEEYAQLLADCADALNRLRRPGALLTPKEGDRLRQVVKRYRRAQARDYFHAGTAAGEIEAGINEIIGSLRGMASDLGRQLRSLMEG